MIELVYDEEVDVSYGLWVCPKCGARFYGGGRTLHSDGCPLLPNTMDYDGLEFHFGPSQVQQAIESAEMFGPDHKWYGISLNMLRERFPELVQGR